MKNNDDGEYKTGKPNKPGRPKGVRAWSCVMRECLWLLEHKPDKLEEKIGHKLPTEFKKRDLQSVLFLKHLTAALNGDLKAFETIMRWMDGDPKQTLEVKSEVEVKAVIPIDELSIPLQHKYLKEKFEHVDKLKKMAKKNE